MLGKLFKTEFKASGRLYLPIFICVLFFAAIERVMMELVDSNASSSFLSTMFVIITVIFVIIIMSVSVSGQFISIYRFHKSVFTDEGYLTNTLPVKSRSIIISKLLVGVLYTVFSYIILLVSLFIMTAGEILTRFLDNLRVDLGIANTQIGLFEYFSRTISEIPLTFALLIAILIASLFFNIIMFYTAFAIGNMANNKKVLLSIIIYIGFTTALSFASGAMAILIDETQSSSLSTTSVVNITLAVTLAAIVLIGLIGYFVTNKIMKSKLNLE